MKIRHLFYIAAVATLVAACQSDDLEENLANVGPADAAEGNVTLRLALPGSEFANSSTAATRAAAVGYGTNSKGSCSALGGLTNLDMTRYDVRYKVAVYEKDASDAYQQVIAPQVYTVDQYQEITASFRLLPTHTYRVVCWADFVSQGSQADLHYDTSDLANITVKDTSDRDLNDESRDAYFRFVDLTVGSEDLNQDIVLKRPFAKVRLVTTDWNYGNLEMPSKLKITYPAGTRRFTGLNAVTGNDVDGEQTADGQTAEVAVLEEDVACETTIDPATKQYTGTTTVERYSGTGYGTINGDDHTVSHDLDGTDTDVDDHTTRIIKDYDYAAHNRTLTVDYLWTDEAGETAVSFDYEAYNADGKLIYAHSFNGDIPVNRNYITTILGNLLTVEGQFDVSINENFVSEWVDAEPWWDPTEVTPVEPPFYDGAYHLSNRAHMVWLSDNPSALSSGKVFRLEQDIDMNNINWMPIGRRDGNFGGPSGTFDGNGHVLRNFKIEGKYLWRNVTTFWGVPVGSRDWQIGVFGEWYGTIKDLTFENITIEGLEESTGHEEHTWFAGPIGYLYGNMENVHAKHVFIRGALSGVLYNSQNNTIEDCSADYVYIYVYSGNSYGGFVGDVADGTGVVFKNCTAPQHDLVYYDRNGNPKAFTPANPLYGECREHQDQITIG